MNLGYINNAYSSDKAGYYFSAICVLLGCICLSLVDIHKKQLRKKRRLRHSRSTTSTATSATTTTFQSSSSGFTRLGSSASSSVGSRSILSSQSSTRGRKYRRRNLTSSVGTNSTYCGPSGATNNNSLVLVDEVSNPNVVIGSILKAQPKGVNPEQNITKLAKQGSFSIGVDLEGNNNNTFHTSPLLKSPKIPVDTKSTAITNAALSDPLMKINSPSLHRKHDVASAIDGNKILGVEKNLQKLTATDPNTKDKTNIIEQQKQAIQMNVLGLGAALTASDDKQLIDADEIKIDYRFIENDHPEEKCAHLSSLGISPPQVSNETDKDPKVTKSKEKNKFRRYISMDIEGEEEFHDEELAIDDDDFEHDYDGHDEFIDDDEDDDDGEVIYNVGDLDEMEYLENITSCNQVDNCVMLSEFEQNLIKECEDIGGSESGMASIHGATGSSPSSINKMYKTKSGKRWSMFHGQKDRKGVKKRGNNKDPSTPPRSYEALIHRNKKWNQVLPGPSRAITTIEENSSS